MKYILLQKKHLLLSLAVFLASSCASPEGVKERQSSMNDWYAERQEARGARIQGRNDRDKMWFNRVMGRPIDTPGLPDF